MKDNFVLITGASSGIGKEIALTLSKENNLILHGRNNERLMEVRGLCGSNKKILLWNYDLNSLENLEISFKDFLLSNNVLIKSFIHSAGNIKMVPFKMVNLSIINECMNTNLYSAIIISKLLINRTINNSTLKNILFISSNISNFGSKAFSIYGASKSALDGLMRCLAVELAPNVRVNSILPGSIETPMTKSIYENDEVISRMKVQYPLGLGKTTDIADAVQFLISEKARWITGQQFTIDGGRTINISG